MIDIDGYYYPLDVDQAAENQVTIEGVVSEAGLVRRAFKKGHAHGRAVERRDLRCGEIAELSNLAGAQAKRIAELEQELADVPRWRKCSEELPEIGETVIVALKLSVTEWTFTLSYYINGTWMCSRGDYMLNRQPTHWQPLPEPPSPPEGGE